MKRRRPPLSAVLIIGAAALAVLAGSGHTGVSDGQEQVAPRPAPQIGLNFIRFYMHGIPRGGLDTSTSYVQPDWIFHDFADLGVQAFRQFPKADLLWDVINPRPGQWNWEAADAVLKAATAEPVVSLFRLQYASPTPPWAAGPDQFQRTLGPEAEEYLTAVVQRYAPYVKYWELGNEMDHWRITDPSDRGPAGARAGAGAPTKPPRAGLAPLPPRGGQSARGGRNNVGPTGDRLPDAFPATYFTPREQGRFLAQAAALIRTNDPDAVIVLPGVSAPDEYCAETWIRGVVEGGGKDWFDIVNYHYYSTWERYSLMREQFAASLKRMGLADKPVWLTETGVTSSTTLTIRTNYPNSFVAQAADIFRRIVQAFGHGDAFVAWHTYIGSSETDGNWRAYGIRTDTGEAKPACAAFKLLANELTPFSKAEKISADARGLNAYKFVLKDGAAKYVVWGNGRYKIPAGVTRMVSVVPEADGGYVWQPAKPGISLDLSVVPVVLK